MKRQASRPWIRAAAGLALLAPVLGFLVAASGLVPLTASDGHWAITEWFLRFSKQRSIATHTLGLDLPALDVQWRILKGAGHYESGCRPCHGSPADEAPRIPSSMLPAPVWLPTRVRELDPEYLFYVVKNGIKFTGMPAWPAQDRDDEVVAVVAFLRKLPDLDADAYRAMAGTTQVNGMPALVSLGVAGAANPPDAIAACARCHGADGLGGGHGAFPKLAGQSRDYLRNALTAFAANRRQSGIMAPIATALTPPEIDAIASWYSVLPDDASDSATRTPEVLAGEVIASQGIPPQGVPPCRACHGPGNHARQSAYPSLAGQYAEYLELQLELFRGGQRGGTAWSPIMTHVASRLTPEQIRAVAAWYASLAAIPERLQR